MNLQRITTPPEDAVRFERAFYELDVRELAERVQAPTLIMHARDDAMCPFEGARELAGLIPNSEFVPLEAEPHPARGRASLAAFPRSHRRLPRATRREVRRSTDPKAGRAHTPGARGARPDRTGQVQQRDLGRARGQPRDCPHHITRIFRKLGVRDRAKAVVVAREGGLGK